MWVSIMLRIGDRNVLALKIPPKMGFVCEFLESHVAAGVCAPIIRLKLQDGASADDSFRYVAQSTHCNGQINKNTDEVGAGKRVAAYCLTTSICFL